VVICDGVKVLSEDSTRRPKFKSAIVTQEQAQRYAEFIDRLELYLDSHDVFRRCGRVLRFSRNFGFAGLVQWAVESPDVAAECEFVLVLQHDWVFRRGFCLEEVVAAFDDSRVNYLTFSSLSSEENRQQLLDLGWDITSPLRVNGVSVLPLGFFYDRNHICRVSFYRERVFRKYLNKRSSRWQKQTKRFIEDSFGHIIKENLKEVGVDQCFNKWGLALFVEENEECSRSSSSWKPMLKHLDGRKFLPEETLSSFVAEQKEAYLQSLEDFVTSSSCSDAESWGIFAVE
jgi:hypothetical protein